MRHDFLDRYSRLESVIHRLPSGLKMATAIGLLLATVLIHSSVIVFFGVEAAFLVGVAALSRIPPTFLLRRLVTIEPVILGGAVLNLLREGGTVVFLGIVMKSSLCLFTMILLSNTTTFSDTLRVLKRGHVPKLLITILALMYRYIYVLIDESERMTRARKSRTLKSSRFHSWKAPAGLIGQLFVRSSERAERIYAAMCARGWR